MLDLLQQIIRDTSIRGAAVACGVNRNSVRWWLSHGLPCILMGHYASQLAALRYPNNKPKKKQLASDLVKESTAFRRIPIIK